GVPADEHQHWWKAMAGFAMRWTDSRVARYAWIGGLVAGAVLFARTLAPKTDYLPVAPTDNVYGSFRLPQGGNLETARDELAPQVIQRLQPYLEGKQEPAIKYYNFSAFDGGSNGLVVAYAKDPRRTLDVVKLLRDKILADLPDLQAFANRGSLLSV